MHHIIQVLQTHKDYYGYKDSEIPYSYSDYPSKNEVLKYLNIF